MLPHSKMLPCIKPRTNIIHSQHWEIIMPKKHVFCGAEVCFYCPLMELSLENNLKSERKDILVNNHGSSVFNGEDSQTSFSKIWFTQSWFHNLDMVFKFLSHQSPQLNIKYQASYFVVAWCGMRKITVSNIINSSSFSRIICSEANNKHSHKWCLQSEATSLCEENIFSCWSLYYDVCIDKVELKSFVLTLVFVCCYVIRKCLHS